MTKAELLEALAKMREGEATIESLLLWCCLAMNYIEGLEAKLNSQALG